jgi:hypothetical protein
VVICSAIKNPPKYAFVIKNCGVFLNSHSMISGSIVYCYESERERGKSHKINVDNGVVVLRRRGGGGLSSLMAQCGLFRLLIN